MCRCADHVQPFLLEAAWQIPRALVKKHRRQKGGLALLASLGGWSGERAVVAPRVRETRAGFSKYQDPSQCAGGSCPEADAGALHWDRGAPAGGSQNWGAPARSHSAAAAWKYQGRRQSAGGSCQEPDSVARHWDRGAPADLETTPDKTVGGRKGVCFAAEPRRLE